MRRGVIFSVSIFILIISPAMGADKYSIDGNIGD